MSGTVHACGLRRTPLSLVRTKRRFRKYLRGVEEEVNVVIYTMADQEIRRNWKKDAQFFKFHVYGSRPYNWCTRSISWYEAMHDGF